MKEWLQGKNARLAGLPINCNPYLHDTWSYFQWVDGWRSENKLK